MACVGGPEKSEKCEKVRPVGSGRAAVFCTFSDTINCRPPMHMGIFLLLETFFNCAGFKSLRSELFNFDLLAHPADSFDHDAT